MFLTFVCCFSRFLLYFYEGIFHKLCKRCSNVMMLLNLYIFPLFWPNIWGIWNILGKNIWGIWNICLFDFSWFPLQIGLMVCHFRYNVDYQIYLVLLTKYLLYHAESFSAFSVTFANRLEKPLNLITEFINLITNCAYEKVIYFAGSISPLWMISPRLSWLT